MSIKYDRLWLLLDEQGISKDAVRKAAGLTALAFSKIENNTSISIEALLKVCAILNCKLEDIAEWNYAYQTEHAIPDIDLDELPTSQFDTLGYHKLYGNLTWIKSGSNKALSLFLFQWFNSQSGKQQLL